MSSDRELGCCQRGQRSPQSISRRDFLQAVGALAAGLLVAGCQPKRPAEGATLPQVAIARVVNYDRALVRKRMQALFDSIGGLKDVIRSGDRVAIKVNLTGGTSVKPLPGVSAIESYITHPEVVRVLGEMVRDAGAGKLYFVEAVYEQESWRAWGCEEVAKALDATLVDLNSPQPYPDFMLKSVGEGWFIYKDFFFNRILEEIDVFISVAKMKCHYSAGVTLAMKNLVGLVPLKNYRLEAAHTYRSAFHGASSETGTRLPRVIVDLNRARPIHFALIDGIKTTDGGEGPWIQTMAVVAPGVLIAGKNPLATDAVATAVMGFDPTAAPMTVPFVRSDNHLNLARELGLGTNRLEEIKVVGASIEDVRYRFKPA